MDETHLSNEALSCLLPMHVTVGADGIIRAVGPTVQKLCPECDFIGRDFFEVFAVRRPHGITSLAKLIAVNGVKLHLQLQEAVGPKGSSIAIKGVAVPCAQGGGVIINLSFGISIVEAVSAMDLNAADFAPTDLAVEMLYLVEAKSAAMEESRKLNTRLQGAKIAAEEQAYTDTLTGLKNRRATDHVLTRFAEAGEPFGLMHLDLDYFKDVNDSLGHAAGDHVLQEVARILVDETRGEDLVARVGGDEFVLLFHRLTDITRLNEIAARIIERLEEPIPFKGDLCRISASIGTTVSDIYETLDVDEMLADADTALYASKHKGRACYTVFDKSLLRDGARLQPPKGRETRVDA